MARLGGSQRSHQRRRNGDRFRRFPDTSGDARRVRHHQPRRHELATLLVPVEGLARADAQPLAEALGNRHLSGRRNRCPHTHRLYEVRGLRVDPRVPERGVRRSVSAGAGCRLLRRSAIQRSTSSGWRRQCGAQHPAAVLGDQNVVLDADADVVHLLGTSTDCPAGSRGRAPRSARARGRSRPPRYSSSRAWEQSWTSRPSMCEVP